MSDNDEFSYDHMSDRQIIISMAKDLKFLKNNDADKETRLRLVEKRVDAARNYLSGAIAVLGVGGLSLWGRLEHIAGKVAEKLTGGN